MCSNAVKLRRLTGPSEAGESGAQDGPLLALLVVPMISIRGRKFWLKLTAGLLFAVVMYYGAYRAANPGKVYWDTGARDAATGNMITRIEPDYPGEPHWDEVFWLAHQLDRVLRHEYWNTNEYSDGTSWRNP